MAVDVDLRQRQHAVTQGKLQARQLVEAQRMHEQAERRCVDEQREQHEQRGRQRDELAGVLGQLVVAGRHHGQHDRDGAAQAAPYQDGLVSVVDRLDEVDLLQDRQHAEHDQAARCEGADRHGGDGQEIKPGDLQQHVGRQHRGQHEDQAARPEFQLLPQPLERRPLVRMQMRGAVGSDRQRRHHGRDDARDVQIAIGDHEGEVGERHRHRGDGRLRFAQPRNDEHRRARQQEAQQQAAHELAQEDHHDATGGAGHGRTGVELGSPGCR